MSKASHTAGPWVVNPLCAQVDCSKPSEIGGLLPIAQLLWPTDERSEAETAANAHLIAAAPELLKALRAVDLARHTDEPDDWQRATDLTASAFAKAEGRHDV